jgi:hypothetical protein
MGGFVNSRTCVVRVVAAAALIAGFALPAYAQGHKGGYIGGGVGWGSADASCDDCGSSDTRESSVAYNARGGFGLTNHLLIGAEFNAWQKSSGFEDSSDLSVRMYNLAAIVILYPMPNGGFFVKGGGGLSVMKAEAAGGGASAALDTANGPGFIVGAGYDIAAGAHMLITPAVNYWYGKPGDLTYQGAVVTKGWSQNVVDLTIGVTFH